MADNAVYDRVFRKLVAGLRQHNVNLTPICNALLQVEVDNAKRAVNSLEEGDYGEAKELVDELDMVVSRFIREADCSG